MLPFRIGPVYRRYLWGGERLRDEHAMDAGGTGPLAEAWTLSARDDGDCPALDGPHAGMGLSEIVRDHPEIVSPRHAQTDAFPLLVKLIDAREPLSVQVHPDDALAARWGDLGKTEMWHVLEAEEGAELLVGFRRPTSREEAERAIADGTFAQLLDARPVRAGDTAFVPAGTVHCIGAGILLAEVQQSSDLTWRVFDHGRVGPDGRPRELHVARALEAMRMGGGAPPPPGARAPVPVPGGRVETLARCEQFGARVLRLDGTARLDPIETFASLLCVSGGARLVARGAGAWDMPWGTSIFVPADAGPLEIEGRGDVLIVTP